MSTKIFKNPPKRHISTDVSKVKCKIFSKKSRRVIYQRTSYINGSACTPTPEGSFISTLKKMFVTIILSNHGISELFSSCLVVYLALLFLQNKNYLLDCFFLWESDETNSKTRENMEMRVLLKEDERSNQLVSIIPQRKNWWTFLGQRSVGWHCSHRGLFIILFRDTIEHVFCELKVSFLISINILQDGPSVPLHF